MLIDGTKFSNLCVMITKTESIEVTQKKNRDAVTVVEKMGKNKGVKICPCKKNGKECFSCYPLEKGNCRNRTKPNSKCQLTHEELDQETSKPRTLAE